jgi:hypothetical protein
VPLDFSDQLSIKSGRSSWAGARQKGGVWSNVAPQAFKDSCFKNADWAKIYDENAGEWQENKN